MTIERRFFPGAAVEIRAAGDGTVHVTGYGARFNEWSPVYGYGMFRWRERVAPSFFDDVMEDDWRGLFNHDANFVLGRVKAGTMTIEKDEKGLRYDIVAPTTQSVQDFVVEPIRRGDISGSSFSFELKDEEADGESGDSWVLAPDGVYERTLLKARCGFDLGPVVFPFYPTTDTSIAQRSLEAFQKRTELQAPPVVKAPADAAAADMVAEGAPADPPADAEQEQAEAAAVDQEAELNALRTRLAGVA